jgi:hypothetical protein
MPLKIIFYFGGQNMLPDNSRTITGKYPNRIAGRDILKTKTK